MRCRAVWASAGHADASNLLRAPTPGRDGRPQAARRRVENSCSSSNALGLTSQNWF